MRARWMWMAAINIGLVVITILAYWPVTKCSFISFDDPQYVYLNAYVSQGLSWASWKYAWSPTQSFNWHPLTWLSLELDASIWGVNPFGYHVTNLVFHIVNTLLVFLVLSYGTQTIFRSACVAALFALHPLHVESVAWISERKDVLSTFFLLLTTASYIWYATRPSAGRYTIVLILLALGLLAKPMLVTLPVLLMLLDFWPLDRIDWTNNPKETRRFPRRSMRSLAVEKCPMLGLAFIDGLITAVAQNHATKALPGLTLDVRIAHMFHAYEWYLRKTFVPFHLGIFYPHPERTLSWQLVLVGAFVLFVISVTVIWHYKTKRYLLVGWLWFLISFLPVIGLHQVGSQAYADRYAYVPHIGLFILVVWEATSWASRSRSGQIVGGIVTTLILLGCGILTYSQVGYWTNNKTLWTHALEIAPDAGLIHGHLVDVRMADGDYEQAIHHLEQGIARKRIAITNGYCNWGRCLVALNRPAEAEEKFRAALKIDSRHEPSRSDLIMLLEKAGRHTDAVQIANQFPNEYTTQIQLGIQQAQQGNPGQAAVHFQNAVKLAPQSAAAHNNLASAQLELKLFREAKSNFQRALELNPDLAGAHFNLASILETENDLAGARTHFAEVLRIIPNDAEAKARFDRLSGQSKRERRVP